MVRALGANRIPHRKQAEALRSTASFVQIGAGIGSGKTWLGATLAVKRIVQDVARLHARGVRWTPSPSIPLKRQAPLALYWFLGPVYAQTKLQERELATILAEHAERLVLSWVGGQVWLKSGALIEFKTGERPQALVGATLDGLWITEAARAKPDLWNDSMYTRLRGQHGREKTGWCITDTSPRGRNWYWREFWRKGDPNDAQYDPAYENFTWTTADNDASPATVASVEAARRNLPWRYFRRDYLASWEAFEGQVYDQFERRIHVVEPDQIPREFTRCLIGEDFGFRNPGVVLVGGVTGDDDLYIVEEHYESGRQVAGTSDSWAACIKDAMERRPIDTVVCDPSRPDLIDALVSEDVPAMGAENEIEDGIRRVSLRMFYSEDHGRLVKRPRLFVSSECPNLIREIEGYHYDPNRAGETPVKRDDHAVDALRYLVASLDTSGAVGAAYETAESRRAASRMEPRPDTKPEPQRTPPRERARQRFRSAWRR